MADRGRAQQDPDIAQDPDLSWRFLKMVGEQVGAAGGAHGLDIAVIDKTLTGVEALVGPALTAQGLNLLGAAVQNPEALKKVIRRLGFPEQINALIDETIDSSIASLRTEYLARKRLTATQLTTAVTTAGTQLRAKLQAIATYAEAKVLLGEADQKSLDDIVARLRRLPEGERVWDHYRKVLIKPALLRGLARQQGKSAAEILEWLQGDHGVPVAASKEVNDLKATLAGAGKAATAWIAGEVKHLVHHPADLVMPYMRQSLERLDEEQKLLAEGQRRLAQRRQQEPGRGIGLALFLGVALTVVVCIAAGIVHALLK